MFNNSRPGYSFLAVFCAKYAVILIIALTIAACSRGGGGGGGGANSPVPLAPITLVSVDSAGNEANDNSYQGGLSGNGRYVAFNSAATNLVAGITNAVDDVYLRDVETGVTTRVSVASGGTELNSYSSNASVSDDGRFVVFSSDATNLVAGDTNAVLDIFLHDTQNDTTIRVSVDSNGIEGDGNSVDASVSSDGRYVTFISHSTNLVANDTNAAIDIFQHDTQTGSTTLISKNASGVQANARSSQPSMSSDGRYVVFNSEATNLSIEDVDVISDVYLHDTQTGTTSLVSVDSNGIKGNLTSDAALVSDDGRYVTFISDADNLVANDTNSVSDIFRRDTQTGITIRVSVSSTGVESNADIIDIDMSGDGRYVGFFTSASSLVDGDGNGVDDVFVRDVQTGLTRRVSVNAAGEEANDQSTGVMMSSDGNYVSFVSTASNLVTLTVPGIEHAYRAPTR